MSYVRPSASAADAQFGSAYARPAASAADATFPTDSYTASGAVTLDDLIVAGIGCHGVSGVGAVTLGDLIVAGVGDFELAGAEGAGAVTLGDLIVAGVGAHGVAGAGAVVLDPVTVVGAGAHGVSGVGVVTLGDVAVAGLGAHGVAGAGAVTLGDLIAVGVALHPRYRLKGEVRDGGVLVNRRVRAYPLDTGELYAEQDTTVGAFDIHAGFAERMFYLTPVDLSEGATDFRPPTANRVLSKLVMD